MGIDKAYDLRFTAGVASGGLAIVEARGRPQRPNRHLRSRAAGALGIGLLGATCGVAAKFADERSWRWASDLGTYPAVWIFSLVLIGRFGRSAGLAGMNAAVFCSAVVIAYYAWAVTVLGFGFTPYLPAIWLGASFLAAPCLAAAVWFGSHGRLAPWIVGGPVAAVLLADGPLRQYWNRFTIDLPDGFPFHPVQAGLDVVMALATIAILAPRPADRVKAVAVAVPLVLVAEFIVGALSGVLGT